MLMCDCWGGEKRGGDANICKHIRIRKTFNRFKNTNQRSTELTEFAIHFFSKYKLYKKIEVQNL